MGRYGVSTAMFHHHSRMETVPELLHQEQQATSPHRRRHRLRRLGIKVSIRRPRRLHSCSRGMAPPEHRAIADTPVDLERWECKEFGIIFLCTTAMERVCISDESGVRQETGVTEKVLDQIMRVVDVHGVLLGTLFCGVVLFSGLLSRSAWFLLDPCISFSFFTSVSISLPPSLSLLLLRDNF